MNDFVLSLLPELGTMGSKWGGAGVTRSSTSYKARNLASSNRDFSLGEELVQSLSIQRSEIKRR